MTEIDIMDLRVKDVYETMVGTPAIVRDDAVLKDAVEAMTKNHVSKKVYVMDPEGKLMGMISIETMLKQVGFRVGIREQGVIPFFKFLTGIFKENVQEVMVDPITVTNNDKVVDALRKMVENHLNDLPVIDHEGKIIGELNGIEILEEAKRIFNNDKPKK